ncbi:MAG: TorF family putative porin [Pseudomonadota bacterium]
MKIFFKSSAALLLAFAMVAPASAELSANISVANNYLWRGLTQSINEPAVSGGIDYAHESGFYVGTWVSNVSYGSNDAFNYEHDIYVGYAGEYKSISYDFGFLYYNYDEEADFDFGELYGSLGYGGFSLTAYLLTHSEADEDAGQGIIGRDYDNGFGETYYLSADYGFEVRDGLEIGLHLGYHDGDFVDHFNFGRGEFEYFDYNVSIAKGGFGFMVSHTTLDEPAGLDTGLQNSQVKYVVSYSVDFDL